MKNWFYRAYQLATAALLRVKPVEKQKMLKGAGSLVRIGQLLKEENLKSVEIITTTGTIRRGTLNLLLKEMDSSSIRYSIFDGVIPDPDIECIEEAVKVYKEGRCQAVIAVGGGSALDCAKMVCARIARPKKSVRQMKGLLKIHKKLPMLIAVPTTAGTGSEITVAAVITDKAENYKFTVMDFCLLPEVAVLDPELTAGLPGDITGDTGMDAFTHAIEAYTNKFSSQKMNEYALKAMKLIDESLLEVSVNGNNMEARENMLMGSYYAGLAFTNAYVGYVHAIAHGLGGLYHIPHGRACAMVLPVVMDAYGKSAEKRLSEVSDHLGIAPKDAEASEKAEKMVEHIRYMNKALGIPEKVEELKAEDIPEIARRAAKEANPAYPVPAIWSKDELEKVIARLML